LLSYRGKAEEGEPEEEDKDEGPLDQGMNEENFIWSLLEPAG